MWKLMRCKEAGSLGRLGTEQLCLHSAHDAYSYADCKFTNLRWKDS